MNENPFATPDATATMTGDQKRIANAYYQLCETILSFPSSRERSVAVTNLQQSFFWAMEGIRTTKKD